MGFRIGSSPDYIDKVWPIRVSPADPGPKDPLHPRLLHRIFFAEHTNGDRTELEIFAWARLQA